MNIEIDNMFFSDLLDLTQENQNQKAKLKLVEGERREVAILFADIMDSTLLVNKLGDEVFKRVVDGLFKRFTRCITYYGGFVDKYMGDGIMALFGAKQASEYDTERAVLAALRMLEQVPLYNLLLKDDHSVKGEQIRIRVGINSGLVLVGKIGGDREGDFTVMGTAVSLAQRMEANAPENKILLPQLTKEAVERMIEFEPYKYVQAKGYIKPIECFTVLRPKLDKDFRWHNKNTMFIGRDKELSILNHAFYQVERKVKGLEAGSSASIIGIKGDAGLGKSRLVFEFFSTLNHRAQFIKATASSIIHSPFNLFANLFEHEFHIQINEDQPTKRRKLDDAFASLAEGLDPIQVSELLDCKPMIGAILETPIPDVRLKQSGSDLLNHLKQAISLVFSIIIRKKTVSAQPVVLVFDDIHWIDESSLAILTKLTMDIFHKQTHEKQVLLLLIYRQDFVVPASIRELSFFQEIELSVLSETEISRLLHYYTSDYALPETTIEKVKTLSAGNPFYLEEWCNYIREIPRHDLKDVPVPTNLHALILSRLDLLDNSIRQLLQKASVIGHKFFVDILHKIEENLYNPIDVDDTLNQLEAQAFILKLLGFDYSAYFFKHITTRDVAYQTLLLENRAILHKLVAEAIEELYPDGEQEFLYPLADHYHRSGVQDKAIYYLNKAAQAAQKAYSNKLSIELFEKLLTWLPANRVANSDLPHPKSDLTIPHPYEVLLNLSKIKWLIGQWDESDLDLAQAYVLASEANDLQSTFDCIRLKGVSAFMRGDMDIAGDFFQQALKMAGEYPQEDAPTDFIRMLSLAYGNLGNLSLFHKQFDEAIEHYKTSLQFAEQINEDQTVAKTLSNLGLLYTDKGVYAQAEEYLNQCLTITEKNRFLKEQSLALGNLGYLFYKQKELDKSLQFFEQKWQIVDKMDDKFELLKVLGNIGNIHRDKGHFREALESYQKVLILKETLGNAKEMGITYCVISQMLDALERHEEAIIAIDKAIELGKDDNRNLPKYLNVKEMLVEKT